ncbi:MAG: lamin tail domain-containing protein [Verrucomicrobia bacterium]|nr:lamin tail domain-containing protein [Verrucomicrobiota bacterium]
MLHPTLNFHGAMCLVAGSCLWPAPLHAQSLPADVGTTVAGFQDDFEGDSLNPNWAVRGQNVYSVSGGLLHVSSATGDPNHLLYELAGYDTSIQEVLARIRVTSFGSGDPARAGVAACVEIGTSQGINLHFRDEPNPGQRHMEFLDDAREWAVEYGLSWQNHAWYWLRLRHEPNAASQGGLNDVFGKIWLADGTQAEPSAWQMAWNYTPTRSARTGCAGIAAGSLGGVSEFDVDYVLIKASGLPSIWVAPNAFVRVPATITNQPQSQTVTEGASVTFAAGVVGSPAPSCQWYRDETPIPGATNASYTLPIVQLADHGAVFKLVARNILTNTTHTATSSNAVLSVQADLDPPGLRLVQALNLTQVHVLFSERVAAAAATHAGHYAISNAGGALAIRSAWLDASGSNVVLQVGAMTENTTYTLVVNGLTDTAAAANPIPPDTATNFTTVASIAAAIGNPQPPGGTVAVPGGLDVTGGGAGLGGTSDQCQFSYLPRTGDFDVKVRVASMAPAGAWSKAALIAREDLAAGARSAGSVATPSMGGSWFQYRGTVNGPTASLGSFPVNYPGTWLRLRRAGGLFTGYAGVDGQAWSALGSATLTMPDTVLLGFAVSSQDTNDTATGAFRDFAEVTTASALTDPLGAEPLGQCSRRTSLVISEIMYNPLDRPDGRNLEFVELFNALSSDEDISGWRLDGDADFPFPAGTVVPAGGFVVVAQCPSDVEAAYGITGVLGPFSNTNSLPNTRGAIRLRHRTGAVFLDARYDTVPPWPVAADGAGHSLVLARPSYGEAHVDAWAASDAVGGSPGRLDPVSLDPLRGVAINEFLARTVPPALDFVELHNRRAEPLDLGGCVLTDDRNLSRFSIPPHTLLPPGEFIAFDQDQLGFALEADGETIYLRNPSGTRVLDAVRFGPQARGVAAGHSPDGAPGWVELAMPTPAAPNAAPLPRDIVIHEIMYHPISGDSDDEFVELHNRGAGAVSVGGWRLEDGIEFMFPPEAVIPAGGYLVVARNAAWLRPRYPNLDAANTVGDFAGSLANGGERVALARPEITLATNHNVVVTNIAYVVVDEVDYRDGGRWGRWADGGGSSLELTDPRSDNRLAANWADSDESAKAPWTHVSVTGILDLPNGSVSADQLQVLLQGPGECLVDNVEVLTVSGANLIPNSTFESGATGWTAEGTEEPSGLEIAEGFESPCCYHVRATDRGDNQLNRIRTPLTSVPGANTTNTIRAKVRWLRGHPEILFRLRGNWLEAPVLMDLPTHLGTPGAPNSRTLTNAPPAIWSVSHHPILPAAQEIVRIAARVHDPDGVASVQLDYRLDPQPTVFTVPMRDDGTAGDAQAGDGLYTALLPGQPANVLAAFHVRAADGSAPAAWSAFPNDAPTRECLVRFGESVPPGTFPSYRVWMTQATFATWDSRNNLNNTMNDVTFVLGNHRVVYNAQAVYAGSPYIAPGFTTPTGNRCGYTIDFPGDDPFLGDTALVLDWPGGHGRENTALQEQMAYWIADRMNLPFCHRYFIRLTVNGVTDMQRGGIFEAVLQPGGEFIRQWSPDDTGGDFYKIDRAFEFNDGGGRIADPEPQLKVYTTRDVATGLTRHKTAAYRWIWLKRFYDRAHDYTNLFLIADALNAAHTESYTAQSGALADLEQWMGVFAFEHIIVNFDSWGHDIGKNMYMYKPARGRWQLYPFDLDWLMLVSVNYNASFTATSAPLFLSDDPTVERMYNHPPFRRAYFRAVQTAVNRAFVPALYEPLMDARHAALVANGITLCDGQALAPPTAVKTWFSQRRDALLGQLDTVAAGFAVTSNGGQDLTVSSNLVLLAGTAPVEVARIRVNGADCPVTWTSVTGWTLPVLLTNGLNALTLEGCDADGNPLPGLADTLGVTTGTSAESPLGQVVISEIMYDPAMPGAEFVEVFNRSATTGFDLSGWRLNGIDFTFPPGSFLLPGTCLVAVQDPGAFTTAYGISTRVAGTFAGRLDNGGETLSLIHPGPTPAQDTVIARVTYDDDPPWPQTVQGTGVSLQLIDARQHCGRVANWTDGNGWLLFHQTATAGANATNVVLLLSRAGDLYVDDIALVEGTQPGVGVNLLANPGFDAGALSPWRVTGNHTNTAVAADPIYSGTHSLHIVATGGGSLFSSVSQPIAALNSTGTYTFSFRYLPNTSGAGISFRISSGFRLAAPLNCGPVPASPGTPNLIAASLPEIPPVWLNELLPDNVTGLLDNTGDRDPWVELYNAGPLAVSLDGWHLADNVTHLTQWAFPAGATLQPGEFRLVWLDGEPGESTADAWHAGFRVAPSIGSLALVFPLNARPTVLDYIHYALDPDCSAGWCPDGQPGPRQTFFTATPGAANHNTPSAWPIAINEWMAANTGFLADPADDQFDDWLELYNPNAVAVDLSGYALTDNPDDPARWPLPAGTTIAPHGFLLVWADDDPEQNSANPLALHADFKLAQTGEAIGLFAPDGTPVDVVRFDAQTNNVSHGRWPDGTDTLHFMNTPTPAAPNLLPAEPPELTILNVRLVGPDEAALSWTSEPGRAYRVQSADRLDGAWTDRAEVTATGALTSATNRLDGALQRFYRIQQPAP